MRRAEAAVFGRPFEIGGHRGRMSGDAKMGHGIMQAQLMPTRPANSRVSQTCSNCLR